MSQFYKYQIMKNLLFIFFLTAFCSFAHAQTPKVSTESQNDFATTTAKLEKAITAAGMTIFSKIDHQQNATGAGMQLDSTVVYIFGNPKAGTLLMNENPAIAAELPLKITIYKNGIVYLLHDKPTDWAIPYGIIKQKALLTKMEQGLDMLIKTAAN